MTGSNTDAVSTPLYVQASALLHKLASPLFQGWVNDVQPLDKHYNAWFTLRKAGEVMIAMRSRKLNAVLAAELLDGLKACYELAHDPASARVVEECPCAVCHDLRDLSHILRPDETAPTVFQAGASR